MVTYLSYSSSLTKTILWIPFSCLFLQTEYYITNESNISEMASTYNTSHYILAWIHAVSNDQGLEKSPHHITSSMKAAHSETFCDDSGLSSLMDKPSRRRLFVEGAKKKFHRLFEKGGMTRVEKEDQVQAMSFIEIFNLWQSVNLAAGNIILASLGPSIYNLGFLDASLCAVFAAIIGSYPAAYICTYYQYSTM